MEARQLGPATPHIWANLAHHPARALHGDDWTSAFTNGLNGAMPRTIGRGLAAQRCSGPMCCRASRTQLRNALRASSAADLTVPNPPIHQRSW